MPSVEQKLKRAVKLISTLLALQKYEELSMLTAADAHLTADDIATAVADYPSILRVPTDEETQFDATEVEGKDPREWIVEFPIFTNEEGRSDLTARVTEVDGTNDRSGVIFYDVWVM